MVELDFQMILEQAHLFGMLVVVEVLLLLVLVDLVAVAMVGMMVIRAILMMGQWMEMITPAVAVAVIMDNQLMHH
jgi:hypothetical protein